MFGAEIMGSSVFIQIFMVSSERRIAF